MLPVGRTPTDSVESVPVSVNGEESLVPPEQH